MPRPRLLAIDAATDTVHLALVAEGEVSCSGLAGGAQASAQLIPAIQALLHGRGVPLAGLDAIGFGRGPGAFTGLRTACAVAQGLALGSGRPLMALDTLAAVAQSAHRLGAGTQVWAATDARMGEIYAACWQQQGAGHWHALSPVALYSPAALAEAVADLPASVAGNALGLPGLIEALTDRCPLVGHFPQAAPEGGALAELALGAWARGELIDPALALPHYVRDKVALTTQERAALRIPAGPVGTPAARGARHR
jgi:tRNA threonylcarbamoyladenosine biosynthesis protein TsaB